MPFDAPFKLGPFTCDCQGRLSPCEEADMPAFLFRWRGRCVHARIARVAAGEGRLLLEGTLGRIPSTASAPDNTLRPRSFAVLRWLPRAVPPDWRVSLGADHCVRLETAAMITLPITAAALITEITVFLLALDPYLELLDEGGLARIGAAAETRAIDRGSGVRSS